MPPYLYAAVIACAVVVIAAEVICSFALRRCARDADRLAILAAQRKGRGREEGRDVGPPRYVRAYAPLTLRVESAAKTSPRDGSVTLVFPASPGSPEAQLVDDVLGGAVSRLVIQGVLVDVVACIVDTKTESASIRVASSAAKASGDPTYVQPASISLGAEVLAASALARLDSSPIVRVVVIAL